MLGICCVPVSNIKKDPSHRSELVSQAIFGEYLKVLNVKEDNWIQIQTIYDEYNGWILDSHVDMDNSFIAEQHELFLAKNITTIISYEGEPMLIPFGSHLNFSEMFKEKHQLIIEENSFHNPAIKITAELIKEIAFKFINTSYVWGGKSIFGIDCSGFSQSVFKFINIPILRDASQQATQGETIQSLKDAVCGDLAFFDNAEGRITHVGILLNESEIIHASGKVRIDDIDHKGITNRSTGLRTHSLKLIKRYFSL